MPCVSIVGVLEESTPSAEVLCMGAGIFALGLVTGFIAWIGQDHHFQFKDGEIRSIGRRILWRLALKDIESTRIYKSGDFVIWWLKTKKTEKGIRIYPSLQKAMQNMIEPSASPHLQSSVSGDSGLDKDAVPLFGNQRNRIPSNGVDSPRYRV